MIATIYVLLDEHNEIRYVGKTTIDLAARLRCHIKDRKKHNDHKSRWISEMVRKGYRPTIRKVQEVPSSHWEEAERYWISYFKENGCRLTNSTIGGGDGARIERCHTVTTAEEAAELYNSGASIRAVGRALGCEYHTARSILLRAGCTMRQRTRERRADIDEDELLVCTSCRGWKRASEFALRSNKTGTLRSYCKACHNLKYNRYSETAKRRRNKHKYPVPCPKCRHHRKLDNNGDCWKCNRERGLRQCKKCNELLPEALSFEPRYATCRQCR